MAKRKIEIFVEVQNEKEFFHILESNDDKLICAEIYCHYFGSCTCMDRLFTTIKLDWSKGQMMILKVPCDEIDCLNRFRDHSEPVYMFIFRQKVTKVFRGVDNLRFAEVVKSELNLFRRDLEKEEPQRCYYELDEATPDEEEWLSTLSTEKQRASMAIRNVQSARHTARKRHRAELMVPHLSHLNFVLFWPHTHHAHPALYEKWADNNIYMVAREVMQLNKDQAEDVFYAGDAPINEASIHVLLSGPALAICFRYLEQDQNFAFVVRSILYEEKMPFGEDGTEMSAFDYFKSYSKPKEEILQLRREEKERLREEELRRRARRLSEMKRLAVQARQEAVEVKRAEKEQLKIEYLRTGKLDELEKLKEEPENDEDIEASIPIPEELPEDIEVESSEEEEDEYFPPPDLLIPGFYAPPNDIAKVNGLAILFPSLVLECVTPQPEHLPAHVLVMVDINRRHEAIQALRDYRKYIIHIGIFKGASPYQAVHVAYSVKQFDAMGTITDTSDLKIAFMMSLEKDVAVLQLMDFNPPHVSRDGAAGEEECAALFPVRYGDDYDEFEDFDYT